MRTQFRIFGRFWFLFFVFFFCNCKNTGKLDWICGGAGHKELGTFFFLPEFMGVWHSEAHIRVTNSWITLTVQSK